MSQVGGDTSLCCRDDLEGESGRVVRLQCHGHHCREGMMGEIGDDDDEHRLDTQNIVEMVATASCLVKLCLISPIPIYSC